MSIKWIKTGLLEILRVFHRILDDNASTVVHEAIAGLEESKKDFDAWSRRTHHRGRIPEPWGYAIHPNQPLCFKRSNAKGAERCWADLHGYVLWQDDPEPVSHCIHLRLWSDDLALTCREDWDAQTVLELMAEQDLGARVLLRCHFDRADPDLHGPLYHLQFGGGRSGEELCWHPPHIKLPRLAYPPMDLILACQMVAANLHWSDYVDGRSIPEWVYAVRESQRHLLSRYYECCYRCVTNGDPLLDALWNV